MAILTKIFPILVPLALLLIWIWWYKRKNGVLTDIKEVPWYGLIAVGFICLIILVILFRFQSQEDPRGSYFPATLDDGEIKPGRIE